MRTLEFLRVNAPFLSVGVILTFCSSFGQTFLISVFAGEIRAEFDLSHGTWGGIYSLGTLASAVVMLWAGTLTDRFRVRTLGVATLLILASACLMMAAVPGAWALPFIIFALRFAGQGMTSHTAAVAMSRWFVATRGRALSIATLGFSIGESFLPMLLVAVFEIASWRTIWAASAVLLIAITPIIWRLLRLERTPQSVAADDQAAGLGGMHWSRPQVLGHWLFWAVVPSVLITSASQTAFFFQQVHVAETKGWAHAELVALFPVFTGAGFLAMLASGWALDMIGTRRLMPFYLLPLAAGMVVMAGANSIWAATFAFVLMGISQGAHATLPNAFWAEVFGTRHLGAIKSMAHAVMVLGSALGPGISGYLIDRGLIFDDQMIGIAAIYVFACLCLFVGLAAARRKFPVTA